MPSDHKIVSGAWTQIDEFAWECPDDCDPDDLECGHVRATDVHRTLEFTYDNGTEGVLVPFDVDDLCEHITEVSLS